MFHSSRFACLHTLALSALLLFIVTACNRSTLPSSIAPTSDTALVATPVATEAASASDNNTPDAGGRGIDQTRLDVCAIVSRTRVEAVIGALAKAPKAILPIGNEVGCHYASDARSATISVYNLDRWDLFTQGLEGTPVSGIGDGGLMVKEVDGSHTLYVLLRDRAVVGIHLSGENMQEFRQLVDATQAEIQ